VNEDEFESLRRWGDALIDDRRPEVRAAGKAILLLAAEIERLQLELWHARLGVTAETDDEDDAQEPVADLEPSRRSMGFEGLPSVLARLARKARRAPAESVERHADR
jgi:hypothetical protein